MFATRFYRLGVCSGALLLAALPLLRAHTARADRPESVVRTFGFLMDVAPVGPDYEGENSIAVVALPNTSGDSGRLSFCDCESNGILAGTQWTLGAASHITRGGNDDQGAFLWLATDDQPDAPPPGAVALTGPDGAILDVQVFPIRNCGAACVPSTSYQVSSSNPTDMLVVVRAIFSK